MIPERISFLQIEDFSYVILDANFNRKKNVDNDVFKQIEKKNCFIVILILWLLMPKNINRLYVLHITVKSTTVTPNNCNFSNTNHVLVLLNLLHRSNIMQNLWKTNSEKCSPHSFIYLFSFRGIRAW